MARLELVVGQKGNLPIVGARGDGLFPLPNLLNPLLPRSLLLSPFSQIWRTRRILKGLRQWTAY